MKNDKKKQSRQGVSRRRFLQGTAIGAVAVSGANLGKLPKITPQLNRQQFSAMLASRINSMLLILTGH